MNLSLKIKTIIIGVLLILLFVGLNFTGASQGIRNVFYGFSSPIQKVFWRAGDRASDFFGGIYRAAELKKENEALMQKNQELLTEIIFLGNLKQENKGLREALGLDLQKDFDLILTEVIAKDIGQDFILINKGSKHGILQGQPVITSQKVLCGRISEVHKDFSKVILITNKNSSFDAIIPEKDISGVVKGKGNLVLYLDLILKEQEIKEKDIVITAALGGIFPKGLLVGKIKQIKKSDIEPFQRAELSPFFDITDLDNLFIVANY